MPKKTNDFEHVLHTISLSAGYTQSPSSPQCPWSWHGCCLYTRLAEGIPVSSETAILPFRFSPCCCMACRPSLGCVTSRPSSSCNFASVLRCLAERSDLPSSFASFAFRSCFCWASGDSIPARGSSDPTQTVNVTYQYQISIYQGTIFPCPYSIDYE